MEQSSGLRKDMSRITAAHAVPGIFKNINQKRIGKSRIAAAQVVTIIKPILLVVVLCHGFVISPRYFSIWLVMYFCNFCALLL